MIAGVELARAIYEHHRRGRMRSKRSVATPAWDELPDHVRRLRVAMADGLSRAYARPDVPIVAMVP